MAKHSVFFLPGETAAGDVSQQVSGQNGPPVSTGRAGTSPLVSVHKMGVIRTLEPWNFQQCPRDVNL